MQLSKWCVVLLLAALTGCGGGSVSFGVGDVSIDHRFVIWAGNSNGDEVVDANNNAFAFFADNGCLFNFQTERENTHFCLTFAGDTTLGDTALYDGFLVRIANVRSATGVCTAALLDAATGHFIAIGLDSFGTEVVFITALHPDFCFI